VISALLNAFSRMGGSSNRSQKSELRPEAFLQSCRNGLRLVASRFKLPIFMKPARLSHRFFVKPSQSSG